MHGRMRRGRRPGHGERGAVAIMVALSMTVILVVAAMVLDFGLVRVDRQIDKSAADAATVAGLHGLNTGDGAPHPYVGVCTAVRYLKANHARFSGVTEGAGWSNGLGTATGSGCSDLGLRNKICKPEDKSSWARWTWTGTSRGVDLNITVESGYDLAANPWAEDSLPASSGDTGDPEREGCDQLAVTIEQSREPGLGSLATDSDLRTAIRSVGRIKAVPGDSAPAMLLLKRTGCPVLVTGAPGGGSFIRVNGAVSSDGNSQPGTIHSDSDGAGCTGGNNSWVYGGLAANGIVAFAAPLVSNLTSPDPAKPGSITSVAAANGLSGAVVRDSSSHVYGSSLLSVTDAATKTDVTGRSLVTRGLVDQRYFGGVKPAMDGALSVFAAGATAPPAGWTNLTAADPCKPTAAEVSALNLNASSNLYVNCNSKFVGDAAGNTINAGRVYFRGWVNPAASLKLPQAHHVYVGNHGSLSADAISIGTGAEIQVNTVGNLDATGNCTTGQSTSKAVLFVRRGTYKQTGGLLRMCRTTAMMLGGGLAATTTTDVGCVPRNPGAAPTNEPCPGATSLLGSGQFTQQGGGINWTAPDSMDLTTDPVTGEPTPAAVAAWNNPDGPEDLALWSESGTSASSNFSMAGGGLFRVRGVFMVPNADPMTISGGSTMNLTNAQYVASSLRLNGNNTSVTMSVEPNSAVVLPDQGLVGLVR